MKRKELIIIGPCASGKSTIAIELAKRLDQNCFQLDLLRWYYFYKNGYNLPEAMNISESNSIYELNEHWKPYHLLTMKNVLAEFKNGVFDFGGTYTLMNNQEEFLKVQQILHDFSNIILILPSKNKEKSLQIINDRVKLQMAKNNLSTAQTAERLDLNKRMIYENTNHLLATRTFFFEKKTKEALAKEIIETCFMLPNV